MQDKKRALHQALVDRILKGDGTASTVQRTQAFDNDGLPAPLDALIGKVVSAPTEADLAAVSGCTEDQLFELVVCAAVGESTRLYDTGLAALEEAEA
jgi:hypothetical protein